MREDTRRVALAAAAVVALTALMALGFLLGGDPSGRPGGASGGASGGATGGASGGAAGGQAPDPVKRIDEDVLPTRFRKEGQTYAVKLVLNLNGRAAGEDWGLEAVATVNYLVTMRYDETVLESSKDKLIVERHFKELRHRLFTTVDDVDLSKDLKKAWTLLDYVSVVEPRVGQTQRVLEKGAKVLREKALAESKRLNLDWTPILSKIDKDPGAVIRTLGSKLEGRKVKLIWTEASGVEILGGADGLPEKERRLLERASLLADGALFPNKAKRHGERWKVDARHFNDFLDIGLDGALQGSVSLRRDADATIDGAACATLGMLGGTIQVVQDDAGRELRGAISPKGTLHYDLERDLICRATLEGKAKVRFASRDHLLFKAKFKGTPTFAVAYEATLKE